jgi:hypothetical protein
MKAAVPGLGTSVGKETYQLAQKFMVNKPFLKSKGHRLDITLLV